MAVAVAAFALIGIPRRPRSGPALPGFVLLFLFVASVLTPPAAADLVPASAPASLPEPADSPPAPPLSPLGSSPSSAPPPISGSDSDLSPSSFFNSPPSPPSSEPSPSPFSYPSDSPTLPPTADSVPTPPAATPGGADLQRLRSTPQADQQEADDGTKGGMSAGRKAGIAVGVLFAAAVAVFAFAIYRKRTENIRRASRYAGYSNRREMQMSMV